MALYKRPNSPFWYVEFRTADGKVRRLSTGVPHAPRGSQRLAEEAVDRIRSEDAARQAILSSVPIRQAVAALFQNVEAARARGQKTVAESTAMLRAQYLATFTRWMESKGLSAITHIDKKNVEDYLRVRVEVTVAARSELTAIVWLAKFCDLKGMPGAPPANLNALINKDIIPVLAERERALSLEEAQRLYDEVMRTPDPFWGRFVSLIIETGIRHEEALGLLWEEVELHPAKPQGMVRLPASRTKTRETRDVPVGPHLYEILTGIPRVPGVPHVFVNQRTGKRLRFVYHGWHAIRRRAGLPKARIHDLRHTNLTLLRKSGLSEKDRMDLAGHDRVATHRRYAGRPDNPGLMKRAARHSVLGRLKKPEPKTAKPDEKRPADTQVRSAQHTHRVTRRAQRKLSRRDGAGTT